MHYKEYKEILSPYNSMNLCRGCIHGCIYCDSRSKCYQINHDFEDVEIKLNVPEILENSLRKKRKKCMIKTGSMSDPYIPLKESLESTRHVLELIDKYSFGLAIITKSDLVLRDLDVLKRINRKSKCIVQITLTTYDEELCKILEPNVSTTRQRFEALKKLNEEGIQTIVWLGPILPYINDTEENLLGLLNYCKEANVYGIICFGMGLTLREGNREYFYKKLDAHFPGLKKKYQVKYGNSYEVLSDNNQKLMRIFYDFCNKNNIMYGSDKLFKYIDEYESKCESEQLKLF